MKLAFFSFRNFRRDGGGSIRMYGLINTLAELGHEVSFISNARTRSGFHKSVNHILIGLEVSPMHKAIIQLLTAFLPARVVTSLYRNLIKNVKTAITKNNLDSETIIFCEYLDNTIGYLLSKRNIIPGYINDLHGIVPLEFDMQYGMEKNIFKKALFKFKYFAARLLDRKVLGHATALIYASNRMQIYFEQMHPELKSKKNCVIPNLLGDHVQQHSVDSTLLAELKRRFGITDNHFVFLFAGGYKQTAGVDDLLQAFILLYPKYTYSKLLLIGKGPYRASCEKLFLNSGLPQDVVTFIDGFPYDQLFTYQQLAHVIVCPDKQNPYSNMIVHLKYFDALASGRLVINSAFESVNEINTDESLSLGFEPSNIENLYETMKKAIQDYPIYTDRYKNTRPFALENLTYKSQVDLICHLTE